MYDNLTSQSITPTQFVSLFNSSLELVIPEVRVRGEISSFRIAKNQWVYFDIKDESSSVKCFGSVFNLPGPLSDGIVVEIVASPRLHNAYGFSLNFVSVSAVGEGSINKALQLLKSKLELEGIFAQERKRAIPEIPTTIGLVTADKSAAFYDFIKTINSRFGGIEIVLVPAAMQGEQAPASVVAAISTLNLQAKPLDVIVITRGGGSQEDLKAFNDERVVRAVVASRTPTIVAIGHEVDVSLAELAADARASTPTHAAELCVIEAKDLVRANETSTQQVAEQIIDDLAGVKESTSSGLEQISTSINLRLSWHKQAIVKNLELLKLADPKRPLRQGFAITRDNLGKLIGSAKDFGNNMEHGYSIEFIDGTLNIGEKT